MLRPTACLAVSASLLAPPTAAQSLSEVRAFALDESLSQVPATPAAMGHVLVDLDADGHLDLVQAFENSVAVLAGGRYTVLRGAGDGTFGAPTVRFISAPPSQVAAGDFDSDGLTDLAFACAAYRVHVVRSAGVGVSSTTIVNLLDPPRDIAAADIDFDGDLDLVTISVANSVTLVRNLGAGSFATTHVPLGTATFAFDLSLGDLDGDGWPDLVYVGATAGGVRIRRNVAGSFSSAEVVLPTPGSSDAVPTLGDLDHDGDLDVVHPSGPGDALTVFWNDGAGTFSAPMFVPLPAHFRATRVAVADTDGDGVRDLIGAGALFDLGSVVVVRGLGGGVFDTGRVLTSGHGAGPVSTADLDGDGRDDIVATNRMSRTAKVFLGGTSGAPLMPTTHGLGSQFGYDPVVGDLDTDGDLDVVLAETARVTALVNGGTGDFIRIDTPMPQLGCTRDTHLADLDGDGVLDVLATRDDQCAPYGLLTMRGRGDGTFEAAVLWSFDTAQGGGTGGGNASIATLDWDHDGDTDVAVSETIACVGCPERRVFLFDNDGAGGLVGPREWSSGPGSFRPERLVAGDFDEDGHVDLVATPNVILLRGLGDGTFAPPVVYATGYGASWLAVGDTDLDGHLDVAFVSSYSSLVGSVTGVMLGDGQGAFTLAGVQWGPHDLHQDPAHGVSVGDVTGDRIPDVVAASTEACDVLVFRGQILGGIARAERYGVAGRTYRPTLGDFDGDGIVDIGVGLTTTLPIGDTHYTILRGMPLEDVTRYCSASPNSTSASARIDARGIDVLARRMELHGTDLPALVTAYSLASRSFGFVAFPGSSAGHLCLGGAIGRRVGGQVLTSDATGAVVEVVDLDALPQPTGTVAVQAGESWHFQLWYRDTILGLGIPTSNFTDAVRVNFP